IIDNNGLNLNAFCPGQIRRHLEVQHVTGVILYDVKNTLAAGNRFGRLEHLVRRWTRKNSAWTSGIQHSAADETPVHGFMATSTTCTQRDLTLYRSVCTGDGNRIGINFDQITKRGPKAGNGLQNDVLGRVYKLFHIFWGGQELSFGGVRN